MPTRKKPVHRKQPWFFVVGVTIAVLGLVITAGIFLTKASKQTATAQKTMLVQQEQVQQAPMVKGARKSVDPLPAETFTPDTLKEWISAVTSSLNDLGGLFLTLGGAVMLWLNIKEKKRELAEAQNENEPPKKKR